MIVTVTTKKGGTGKTTTGVTLGHKLAMQDASVLLIDADPQGNCATALGLDPAQAFADFLVGYPVAEIVARPGLALLPGDHTTTRAVIAITKDIDSQLVTREFFIERLRMLARRFDYLVIDTPASGIFQEIAIAAADAIVIPTALDYLAMDALTNTGRTITALNANRKHILIVPTMYQRNGECDYNLGLLGNQYPGHVTDPIPLCAAVRVAVAEGKTVWEHKDTRSRTLPTLRNHYERVAHWLSTPVETLLFGE